MQETLWKTIPHHARQKVGDIRCWRVRSLPRFPATALLIHEMRFSRAEVGRHGPIVGGIDYRGRVHAHIIVIDLS